jgi:hypothetical protein
VHDLASTREAAPNRPIADDFSREASHYQSGAGKLNRNGC